jgi:cytochrome c peroxidase
MFRPLKYLIAPAALVISVLLSSYGEKEIPFRVPAGWPKPAYDFSANPYSIVKVELGRKLFYDPLLSKDNSISCASCHAPFNAFAHTDHALSHGIHDSIGKRNAPGLFNLAWQKQFMWDGAVHHLDMQPLAPISNPAEMGEEFSSIVFKINQSSGYRELFGRAFHDTTVTGQHVLQALSQFMLSLVSDQSRYDSIRRGEAHFTAQEERGYDIYVSNCSTCHREPLFTNGDFERNGLSIDAKLQDKGRYGVTKSQQDTLRFKVPSLRNLEYTAPYMHDGRYKRLQDVINHYATLQQQPDKLSHSLSHPVLLDEKAKVDLMAFLLTLNDRHFILNYNHWDPRIAERLSATTPSK